jgi:hypothetical protein
MRFYLGTHMVSQPWWDLGIDLFVSRRRLVARRSLPQATAPWVLDSGGFTELNLYGYWQTTEDEYVADIFRFEREIGNLAWVAPQDWMCEPFVLEKTRASVGVHQDLTVENFLRLRERLGPLVIPVLQGWTRDQYHNCWGLYEHHGVDLEDEPLVGIGSVCRRQNTIEAAEIIRSLTPLRLHGFGVKTTGLKSYGDSLVSSDSMAWSYSARWDQPLEGHTHKNCANCIDYAVMWLDRLAQREEKV